MAIVRRIGTRSAVGGNSLTGRLTVGQRVRWALVERGERADASGYALLDRAACLAPGYTDQLVNGRCEADDIGIYQLAVALGVSSEWLRSGEGTWEPEEPHEPLNPHTPELDPVSEEGLKNLRLREPLLADLADDVLEIAYRAAKEFCAVVGQKSEPNAVRKAQIAIIRRLMRERNRQNRSAT